MTTRTLGSFVLGAIALALANGCSRAASKEAPEATPSATATASAAPVVHVERTTLYDADQIGPIPGLTYKLYEKHAAAIVTALFPKRLPNVRKCPVPVPSAADARKNGDVVPVVLAEIEGSFTRKGAKEVLDLVATNECGAPLGTTVFGVFEGGKLVARGDFPVDAIIAAKTDIEEDGRDELVLVYQWDRGVTHGTDAKLARLDPERGVVVVRALGELFLESCANPPGTQRQRQTGKVVLAKAEGRDGDVSVERNAPTLCH